MRAATAGTTMFADLSAAGSSRLVALLALPGRPGHQAFLDGWRGVCILMVLAGHFSGQMDAFGSIGVELFFVLSGKLMADLLIFHRQDFGTFFKRRFARIIPGLAAYVVVAGALVNGSFLAQGLPLRIESPVAALLLYHNYIPFSAVVSVFEHCWSLAVEVHSYVLLALIALLTGRDARIATAVAIAVCLLTLIILAFLAAHPQPEGQYVPWRSEVRVRSVVASFAICVIVRRCRPRIQSLWGLLSPLAGLAAVLLLAGGADLMSPSMAICTILAAVAVNGLPYAPRPIMRLMGQPVLVWFGTLSFSLYLWQELFYSFTQVGMTPLLGAILAILCGLWSFKKIEDPSRLYLNRRWSPPSTPAEVCNSQNLQGLGAAQH